MEGSPVDINPDDIVEEILKLDGVKNVHDLHIWSIGSNMYAISSHIVSTTPS